MKLRSAAAPMVGCRTASEGDDGVSVAALTLRCGGHRVLRQRRCTPGRAGRRAAPGAGRTGAGCGNRRARESRDGRLRHDGDPAAPIRRRVGRRGPRSPRRSGHVEHQTFLSLHSAHGSAAGRDDEFGRQFDALLAARSCTSATAPGRVPGQKRCTWPRWCLMPRLPCLDRHEVPCAK